MKVLIALMVVVLSGCATPYTREEIARDEAESNRRVEAMKQAGTYQGPQMTEPERNYATEGFIRGAGYLADKWGSAPPQPQGAPSAAPNCYRVPVTNPQTGQYDLVTQCK